MSNEFVMEAWNAIGALFGKRFHQQCGDAVRDQVGLIKDLYQVVVRGLVSEVLLNATAAGSFGVMGIKDVEDNIRGVEYLV